MDKEKEVDKNILWFIIGGAAMGAFAGYIIKRIGLKNITTLLQAKNIIPPDAAKAIKDFATSKLGED